MAKKSTATEFNMSEVIREILTANPKSSSQEAMGAILAKYPDAAINKNSYSVAFYTGRKKLGIGSSGRGRKAGIRRSVATVKSKAVAPVSSQKVDLAMMQTAAKFLREVGGADAALEAIKQVQAVQVN